MRVIHAVDIVQAGRLNFVENSVVMNMEGFIRVLRHLAGAEDNYVFANWGHTNVGYAQDINPTLDYFQTVYDSYWDTVNQNPITNHIYPAHPASLGNIPDMTPIAPESTPYFCRKL